MNGVAFTGSWLPILHLSFLSDVMSRQKRLFPTITKSNWKSQSKQNCCKDFRKIGEKYFFCLMASSGWKYANLKKAKEFPYQVLGSNFSGFLTYLNTIRKILIPNSYYKHISNIILIIIILNSIIMYLTIFVLFLVFK